MNLRPSFNLNQISKSVKTAIACVGATMIISPSVYAAEEGGDERIVITGSRIERTSAQMTTPTTIIDSSTIMMTGAKNAGDLLHRFPALLDGVGGATHNDYTDRDLGNAGLELSNLRGLGAARTLVLVNGRRHVAGAAGTSAVDLSMIPIAMIARVEIITGGASAIYGADAVTGVVNFIMVEGFEGTQVDASYGQTAEGDGDRKDVGITWGRNINGGKTNITAHLSFSDEEEIPMTARDYSSLYPVFIGNPANTGPDDGIPNTILGYNGRFEVLNEEGLFYVFNGAGYDRFVIDRNDGSFRPFESGNPCGGILCDGGDGFNTQETNTLNSPSERVLFNASARHEVNVDLGITGNVKYAKTESAASNQPVIFHDGGLGPILTLQPDNPYRPTELDGAGPVFLAVTGPLARNNNTRETTQLTFGLDGLIGEYEFDAYIQHGKVESEINARDVLIANYFEALDVTTDGAGNPVCRSGNAACVPYNPINNQASLAAQDYAHINLLTEREIEQNIVAFSMNGDLMENWAGTVAFAAGLEYRQEKSSDTPDPLLQAIDPDGVGSGLVGRTFGATREQNSYLLPTVGDYNVAEIYGEAIIPLVSDATWIEALDFEVAARYSDYSSGFDTSTYKTALNWAATKEFRTRATYSFAVRAPNINELYSPSQLGFSFVTDPCDAVNRGPSDGNIATNCRALGMPDNFSSDAQTTTRLVEFSGNQELNPEEAETFTFGFVITPSPNVNISIDYWDMEITDAITNFDPDDILLNCVSGSSLDADYCNRIIRDANGQITRIRTSSINASKFSATGTDLEVQAYWPVLNGELGVSVTSTYLDEREFQQNTADPDDVVSLAGLVGTPRFRSLITTSYTELNFGVHWTLNYISESTYSSILKTMDQAEWPEGFDNKVEAYVYHNLNFSYTFDETYNVYFGIDNVADKEPPILPGLNAGGLMYDGFGRQYYLGLQAKF